MVSLSLRSEGFFFTWTQVPNLFVVSCRSGLEDCAVDERQMGNAGLRRSSEVLPPIFRTGFRLLPRILREGIF
jgi:hypothetical protein